MLAMVTVFCQDMKRYLQDDKKNSRNGTGCSFSVLSQFFDFDDGWRRWEGPESKDLGEEDPFHVLPVDDNEAFPETLVERLKRTNLSVTSSSMTSRRLPGKAMVENEGRGIWPVLCERRSSCRWTVPNTHSMRFGM
jgi:hypothetical protein